jgi:hypothetical protein
MITICSQKSERDFPAITAVGHDIATAMAVYATLYNAILIYNVKPDGEVTNVSHDVIYEMLLNTDFPSFAHLHEYMREVHDINVIME